MRKDILNIAFGLHNSNGYYIHALTAIYSVLANTGSAVKIHLLHDDSLGDNEKLQFSRLVETFSQGIEFYDMTERVNVFPEIPALKNFSKGTLFRLFVPEILPGHPVLYLDSDIICALDIATLFRMAGKSALCAVRDKAWIREKFRNYVSKALGNVDCYFNAGVLLFNCRMINQADPDATQTIRDCLCSHPNLLFPDQDVLNMVFGKEVKYLPQSANLQLKFEHQLKAPEESLAGKIVHFSGPKPWKEIFPAGMLYWSYRKKLVELLNLV